VSTPFPSVATSLANEVVEIVRVCRLKNLGFFALLGKIV
jgi:hypothetical protein